MYCMAACGSPPRPAQASGAYWRGQQQGTDPLHVLINLAQQSYLAVACAHSRQQLLHATLTKAGPSKPCAEQVQMYLYTGGSKQACTGRGSEGPRGRRHTPSHKNALTDQHVTPVSG